MLLPCYQRDVLEVGCDEAGRGCLAGPVFAAAVILPHDVEIPLLNDSKQLSEKQRQMLRPIIEKLAISWSVAQIDHQVIDKINILNASIFAMHNAIDLLQTKPGFIIVDGNRFKNYPFVPHQTIVKGDGKYMNIAAASILAKTYRDDWMHKLHEECPQYQWNQNKGYPTITHRKAIEKFGLSPYHRLTFKIKSTLTS